jgi:hypothetical protein
MTTASETARRCDACTTTFATAKGRPLLYRVREEWYAFGPPDFQTEMRARIGRGEQPWA